MKIEWRKLMQGILASTISRDIYVHFNSFRVPVRVYGTIHCQGVKYGNENYWNYLWNFSQRIKEVEERDQILKALACSTKVRLLKR